MGNSGGKNEKETITKSHIDAVTKFFSSINNIQNLIKDTAISVTESIGNEIINESESDITTSQTEKIVLKGIKIDTSGTNCPPLDVAEISTRTETKNEFSSIQKAFTANDFDTKFTEKMLSSLTGDQNIENNIQKAVDNLLKAVTDAKESTGPGNLLALILKNENVKTSVNMENIFNTTAENIVNNRSDITNKLKNSIERVLKQNTVQECKGHIKNNGLADINIFDTTIKGCVKNVAKINTVLQSKIIAKCTQQAEISSKFLSDIGVDQSLVNLVSQITKNIEEISVKNVGETLTKTETEDAMMKAVEKMSGDLKDTVTGIVGSWANIIMGIVIVIVLVIGAIFVLPMVMGESKSNISITDTVSSLIKIKKGGGSKLIYSITNFINENKWLFLLLFLLVISRECPNKSKYQTSDIHFIRTPNATIQLLR